jgi:hypothetical protein
MLRLRRQDLTVLPAPLSMTISLGSFWRLTPMFIFCGLDRSAEALRHPKAYVAKCEN